MAPRRKVIPITLTNDQREKLERLWFQYGNRGPRTTPGNHSFIQGLLEHGIDTRPLKQRGYMPTEECERAVERVLSGQQKPSNKDFGAAKAHRLTLISTPVSREPIKLSAEKDNELKELIESLQEKRDYNAAQVNVEEDVPPAA